MMAIQTTLLDEDQRTLVKQYLLIKELPPNRIEEIKLIKRPSGYYIQGGELYRRSTIILLLKCISPKESEYVLKKIHKDIYGIQKKARVLVVRTMCRLLLAYYFKDVIDMVKKCDKYQRFILMARQPFVELITVTSVCLFSQ